jgi:hypothetical protein
MLVRELDRLPAVIQVDAHRDHACDAGGHCRLHHLACMAQLL